MYAIFVIVVFDFRMFIILMDPRLRGDDSTPATLFSWLTRKDIRNFMAAYSTIQYPRHKKKPPRFL